MNDWTAHLAAVILGQLVGAALGILILWLFIRKFER